MLQFMAKHSISTDINFAEYVIRCRALIQKTRNDLSHEPSNAEQILDANAPFEFYPQKPLKTNGKLKYGALLIHGLLDSPFSLKDIGLALQDEGILVRAILLPGHGTNPEDLVHTSRQQWIDIVRYGVDTLRDEVEHIYLIGYSTGAALALYQARHDAQIAGVVALAPAIKLKAPVDIVVGWHRFLTYFGHDKTWVYKEQEIDYAKYRSISFNSVKQVAILTEMVPKLFTHHKLHCPLFMVMSREDETISSQSAIRFFSKLHHQKSQILLYTASNQHYADSRISTRSSQYPKWHIKHFAHIALPFAPNNKHYGEHGDYIYASHLGEKDVIFGAYNRIEVDVFEHLYHLGLAKQKREELTFNPDFAYTAERIIKFILQD